MGKTEQKTDKQDAIDAIDVLKAYDTLREYCRMQRSCENCLLTMGEDEDNVYGNCLMESQGIPMNWKSLDLD